MNINAKQLERLLKICYLINKWSLFQVLEDNLTVEKLLIKFILFIHLEESMIKSIDIENAFDKSLTFLF